MAVLRASLFTIKKGAGKSIGDFIGDFIREPLYALEFQYLRSSPCKHVVRTCMSFVQQHCAMTKCE